MSRPPSNEHGPIPVLRVEGLTVAYRRGDEWLAAVRDLSLGGFVNACRRTEGDDRRSGTPLVLVDNMLQETKMDAVVCDNADGTYQITRHLIDAHGLRRLAFFSGPAHWFSSRERRSGYERAMSEIDEPPRLIFMNETTVNTGYSALHDALSSRLAGLGREAWLREDCARMASNAERDAGDRWPHLSLRAVQFLDRPAQLRLLRLLRWREAHARRADRPRSWILDNELAVLLARDPGPDPAALQRQLDAHPKAPRKLTDAIWQALQTPLDDEADAPEPRNDDRDKQALRRLQAATSTRSAELGLPDGVLASRRWLEQLLGARQGPGEDWPGPLSGWRRAELEPVLAPLLSPDAEGSGLATGGSV